MLAHVFNQVECSSAADLFTSFILIGQWATETIQSIRSLPSVQPSHPIPSRCIISSVGTHKFPACQRLPSVLYPVVTARLKCRLRGMVR